MNLTELKTERLSIPEIYFHDKFSNYNWCGDTCNFYDDISIIASYVRSNNTFTVNTHLKYGYYLVDFFIKNILYIKITVYDYDHFYKKLLINSIYGLNFSSLYFDSIE